MRPPFPLSISYSKADRECQNLLEWTCRFKRFEVWHPSRWAAWAQWTRSRHFMKRWRIQIISGRATKVGFFSSLNIGSPVPSQEWIHTRQPTNPLKNARTGFSAARSDLLLQKVGILCTQTSTLSLIARLLLAVHQLVIGSSAARIGWLSSSEVKRRGDTQHN